MTEMSMNINNGEVKGKSEHNQKPVRQGIRWGKKANRKNMRESSPTENQN